MLLFEVCVGWCRFVYICMRDLKDTASVTLNSGATPKLRDKDTPVESVRHTNLLAKVGQKRSVAPLYIDIHEVVCASDTTKLSDIRKLSPS